MASILVYEDLRIQLGPQTHQGVHVRASCSRGGEASGCLSLQIPVERLVASFPTAVRESGCRNVRTVTGGASTLSARDIGRALFEGTFTGGMQGVLDRSLGSLVATDSAGLRIRLQIDLRDRSQTSLHSLPWELLLRPETEEFLGLSRRSPIVRYLDVPQEVRVQPPPESLRILVLAPDPQDIPPLDLRAELRGLNALQNRVKNIELDFLRIADLKALRSALLDWEPHVLHFMGHGDFEARTGNGLLFLEGSDGRSDPVTSETFVNTIRDVRSIRLVVLNACNSARTGSNGTASAFAGMAPALMRAGVPAALAMQLPISDRAAIAFSEAFYRRLGAGDPVDAAATEGRLAISRQDRQSAEWAVPALFMRVPDGHLFQTEAQHGRAAALGAEPSTSSFRPQPTWRANLLAGNYEAACLELQREIALDPEAALPTAGLAIARSGGSTLKGLQYARAKEMHSLLTRCLAKQESRGLAAASLVALKLDYFRANCVRDLPPDLEEVVQIATTCPIPEEARELLGLLRMSNRAREILARVQTTERR